MQALNELKKLLDFNVLSTRGEVKLAPDQDWSRCRLVKMPDDTLSGVKDHVKIGVRALIANPFFLLADEMGGMKSAQAIIAAQFLYLSGAINRVIVVTPPSVRDVWYDRDLGELSLHLFDKDVPARVSEFHAKIRQWDWGDWSGKHDQLRWIITNYEFIGRSKMRLKQLKAYAGYKTLVIFDESSALANKGSLQSKCCLELRRACGWVWELNGTPITDTPMSLLNQANVLSPTILDCLYITIFRQRYCVMNPQTDFPQILHWKNLDDIQRRFAPYVLRRLKEHCLDLPPKLPPQCIYVPLTDPNWKLYKTMRNDMMAWVSNNQASIAAQAVTKTMRLAQITSGFLGGVEEVFEEIEEDVPEFMQNEDWFLQEPAPLSAADVLRSKPVSFKTVQEVGREKLDAVLRFFEQHLDQDPAFKLVVWCVFKPELHRLMEAVQTKFPNVRVGTIEGGQKKDERNLALRLLHPRTAILNEPALLGGIYGTGSMGHNFTASHVVVNMSHTYSLFKYKQGSDRNHRPGQVKPVSYYDIVATGPDGQKTIDHAILKIRKEKDDIATWTAKAWLDAVSAE